MKPGKILAVFFFVLSGLALSAAADDPYKQTYVILINGEKAGTEAVTEEKDGSGNVISMSEHELLLDEGGAKNRMVFSTKMVLSKGAKNIKTYVCRYKTGDTGDSYEVSIQNDQITRVLTRNGQPGVVRAPFTPNMVVVDFNVYHQYEYLLRRYDRRKKGIQTFANFIPIIGNDIPMKITLIGDETLIFGEKTVEASRFIVELADINTLTLFADKDNRLVFLENTAQGLKVIREDLLK